MFTQHLPNTSRHTSGCFDRYHLVERHVTMFRMLELEFLHSLTQMDPRAVIDLQRRILFLHQRQHLSAVHRLHLFTFHGLAETGRDDIRHILLLHKLQVQLLNTGHLIVVEPIRGILLTQLIKHLSIQLIVIDVIRVVDLLSIWNRQTDLTSTTSGIRQRMRIVGGGYERGITGPVLLRGSIDGAPIYLTL